MGSLAATPVTAELLHVRQGETLTSIARDRLGDAGKWRDICNLNREVFRGNCHKPLEVGLFLHLPTVEVLGPDITTTPDPIRERRELQPDAGAGAAPLGPAPEPVTTLPQIAPQPDAEPDAADGAADGATPGSDAGAATGEGSGPTAEDILADLDTPGGSVEDLPGAGAAQGDTSTGQPITSGPEPSGPIIIPAPAPRSVGGEVGGGAGAPPPGASAVPGAPQPGTTVAEPPPFVPNTPAAPAPTVPASDPAPATSGEIAPGPGTTAEAPNSVDGPAADAGTDEVVQDSASGVPDPAPTEDPPLFRLALIDQPSVPFTIPDGYAGSLAEDGSALFLFGFVPDARPGGQPGVWTRLPDAVEQAVSGRTVEVSVTIIADTPGPIDIAYSTAEVGNSGWRRFDVEMGEQTVSFTYEVPPLINGAGDFIGLLPDPLDQGQIIGISAIEVRLVE